MCEKFLSSVRFSIQGLLCSFRLSLRTFSTLTIPQHSEAIQTQTLGPCGLGMNLPPLGNSMLLELLTLSVALHFQWFPPPRAAVRIQRINECKCLTQCLGHNKNISIKLLLPRVILPPHWAISNKTHRYKSRFLQMLNQGEVCVLRTQKASVLVIIMNKTLPPRVCDLVSDPLRKRIASRKGRLLECVGQGALDKESRDLGSHYQLCLCLIAWPVVGK